MGFGALLLGHRHPKVEAAVKRQLETCPLHGACGTGDLELAELLVSRIPFAERVRFVNSGTEAAMTALRLARGHTGRSAVVRFDGCYHGHLDSLMARPGPDGRGRGGGGIPPALARETLVCELGDLDGVRERLRGGEVAAAIVEPLPANCGLLPQDPEFLRGLRSCARNTAPS